MKFEDRTFHPNKDIQIDDANRDPLFRIESSQQDAVLGNVLVAKIAEATGWVSEPLRLGAVHMVSLVKFIAQ